MNLSKALGILSKSSPYAVSTEKNNLDHIYDVYKKRLFIETEIEKDFKRKLISLNKNDILFLCGSSGDGKSEILTKYSKEFQSTRDFHLDATHSFSPTQTAIQALDKRFSDSKDSGKPLVIGINTGMLGNYAQEGSDEHDDIKVTIRDYLTGKKNISSKKCYFIDFENYPKFSLEIDGEISHFVRTLLNNLTEPKENNPFFILYKKEINLNGHSKLAVNFLLLSKRSIQNAIIKLLLKVRLIKNQFMTARSLLDLCYQLLTSENYLFDKLFVGGDNEILAKIQTFDPSNIHTFAIDQFKLRSNHGIESEEFRFFKEGIKKYSIKNIDKTESFLRLMYILNEEEYLFTKSLLDIRKDFVNDLIEKYSFYWDVHYKFNNVAPERKNINSFYKDILINALHFYINKHSPKLNKDEFLISNQNNYEIISSISIDPDYINIQNGIVDKIEFFHAYLIIDGEHRINRIPININFLELLIKITKGYRPSKHDKNAVLLLDEIMKQVIDIANKKNTIHIKNNNKRYKLTRKNDDYIEISGIE